MENFVDYVEAYFQITPSYEQKGIRELHEDVNKKTYNRQITSHNALFCVSISEHCNGLSFTIDFKCNKKKQDKRLNNRIGLIVLTGLYWLDRIGWIISAGSYQYRSWVR